MERGAPVLKMEEALFVPIENKLRQRPAEKVCCRCCNLELRKGVLILGSVTSVAIIADAPLLFLSVSRILAAFILVTGLIWAHGVWCVYKRERNGSKSTRRPHGRPRTLSPTFRTITQVAATSPHTHVHTSRLTTCVSRTWWFYQRVIGTIVLQHSPVQPAVPDHLQPYQPDRHIHYPYLVRTQSRAIRFICHARLV